MPDDADLIEQCELEFWQIIHRMHKAGVRFEVVHQILKEIERALDVQSYCENLIKPI